MTSEFKCNKNNSDNIIFKNYIINAQFSSNVAKFVTFPPHFSFYLHNKEIVKKLFFFSKVCILKKTNRSARSLCDTKFTRNCRWSF